MQDDDLDEIMRIELKAYPYPWTRGIFSDCLRVGYCCWVLEVDDRLVGYGVMSIGVGEAHVLNICVDPQQQRKGYGHVILEHLIGIARRHDMEMCLLEVRPSNTAAVALYHASGFNEVGVRKNYYPDENGREDALILARNIR
jgi:ribosomal-protein-alanine N-acetyltransferase